MLDSFLTCGSRTKFLPLYMLLVFLPFLPHVYVAYDQLRREQILAAVSEQRSAWRSAVRDYMYKLVSWRKLSTLRAAIAVC